METKQFLNTLDNILTNIENGNIEDFELKLKNDISLYFTSRFNPICNNYNIFARFGKSSSDNTKFDFNKIEMIKTYGEEENIQENCTTGNKSEINYFKLSLLADYISLVGEITYA